MTLLSQNFLYRILTRRRSYRIARAVAPFVPAQAYLLDFGCGNGYTAEYLITLTGCRIKGVDLIRDVNLDERRASLLGFIQYPGGPLPFEAGSFDGVLASAVMHHTSDPLFYLDEFIRVLKPGGRILMVEEMYKTQVGKFLLMVHDYLLNKLKKGVPVPLNFYSLSKYLHSFGERKLQIEHHSGLRPAFPYVRHELFVLRKS
ncbi:MAG: class I SAM-dependent methyltransferase [Flavobacteriales bacterium]|nr:class I SAM-dependent methyltransferase [Flavobacteriales bacterium]MCX7767642.1 class I SAM-dependent methyltransferase [Flavobacteriales bacterium]MDW8409516.1 class I SAM-dependent methyltransferase [Flavobacteriales bacterium]